MLLGIDVGGTFTDFVHLDEAGRVRIHKLLTSARDPSEAILRGIADLEIGLDTAVVHGATVATNALLERRGARTGLITTLGFRDVLEIGRQTRSDLYALHPTRPQPLVPGSLRFEVSERIAPLRQSQPAGKSQRSVVLQPLDQKAAREVAQRLLDEEGVESVAICLLFSFLDAAHERELRDLIASLDHESRIHISLSSDILPEFREYERTSTTVINAYVAPLMSRYLANLEQGLQGRRLRVMQSNGGIISAQSAQALAARTALSGPAGGVVGAFETARAAGFEYAITFDMGGTSTDVSLCPGRIHETTEGTIAGLPLRLPILDIHTVGAGGGSLARLDAGGALRVGPESAGSDPGPLCYGRGEAKGVTVTDANLILGRLDAEHFLGGRMRLDLERAQLGIADLAQRLSLSMEAAAWGVVRVANSNMERAIRTISVERGHDPRRYTLVAFGGAGPLHACDLAMALRIPRVLIAPHPGVLSATGMVLADVVKDYSRTIMLPASEATPAYLEQLFVPLRERAYRELRDEGFDNEAVELLPALDMRYVGQSFELTIQGCKEKSVQSFHKAHRERFSYASEDQRVEIVNLRLKAVGRTAKPRVAPEALGPLDPRAAQVGYKEVHFAAAGSPHTAQSIVTALYDRDRLAPGNSIVGPAMVFQLDTTTVIPPSWAADVDAWGNLVAQWRST